MKIYITAPFKNEENKDAIEKMCNLVKESGFEDFCFIRDIENYQKIFNDLHELMDKTKEELLKCDGLLIDVSDNPSSGQAIEAGMAYILNKKIIIIAKKGTTIKDTMKGITDNLIEYERIEDILEPLKKLCSIW